MQTGFTRKEELALDIKEIQFENYGKCLQISNGLIDAVVTIDFGPRVVRLGPCGGGNLLFTDKERKYVIRGKNEESLKKNNAFYYYGGHRASLTPYKPEQTFYPDNYPVVYSILSDGVLFTSPKQKSSDMKLQFEVVMGKDATDIMIVHTAENCSKKAQTHGIAAATMISGSGTAVIPQSEESHNRYVPNRMIALWPGTALNDQRIFLNDKYIFLSHDSANSAPLKIGINNTSGWSAYIGKKYAIVKRYVHTQQAAYPDFGCSFETEITDDYAELTSLSPIYRIEPGEIIKHVENISIFNTGDVFDPSDKNQIAGYIGNLGLDG